MTVKTPIAPRQTKPELEHDYVRSPALGYEPPETAGFIRCLSHGFPTPLARWHYHDEYELHIITATSGKTFVGDWIGQFQPGQVVLTGPRLPHNWVTTDLPEGGVPLRDLVIQFPHEPLLCEAVFGQMLRVPSPALRPVAYSTLMVDLCKLLRAFPRAMSGCVRCASAGSCRRAGLGTHLAQRASMHA